MKSKYNTGAPIDITQLTAKERKQAFHEWAEGSKALESLLNMGYKKGFLSLGCCGGDTGHPYICYDLNDERSRKMAMCVADRLVNSSHDCKITIYDNFWLNDAYPETYPTRDITRFHVEPLLENKEEVFSTMSDAIKRAKLKDVKLPTHESEIPTKKFKSEMEQIQNLESDLTAKVYDAEEIASSDANENLGDKSKSLASQSKEIGE